MMISGTLVTALSAIRVFGSARSSATATNSADRAGLAAAAAVWPISAASLRSEGREAQRNTRMRTGSIRATNEASASGDGVNEVIEPSAAAASSTIRSFEM